MNDRLLYEAGPPEGTRRSIDYQAELNPAQLEAVTTINGPILVVAGAGTGKTRTLVYRVAYLVEQGVPPESILLLTFTRKGRGRNAPAGHGPGRRSLRPRLRGHLSRPGP